MKRLSLISISTLSGALALGALTNTAKADTNFSYNYAEVGYSFINDADIDQAVKFSASYDINYNVNLLGSYFMSTSSDSPRADDVDINAYALGIGYHADISDSTDVLAEIGLFNSDADVRVGNVTVNSDNSGYTLSAGLRHRLQEKIEVQARVDHRNSDDVTDTSYTFGGRYYFKPKWSAGLDFNTGADDGSESIIGTLRYQFK